MKYLLLIYSHPEAWGHPTFARTAGFLAASAQEQAELTAQFEDVMREIYESGELVDSAPLADPAAMVTVRSRGGAPVATDGPFVEAKEQLAGYFVIECRDQRRALELAARFPDARFGRVEVREMLVFPAPEHQR